jgi:hypothetical protein
MNSTKEYLHDLRKKGDMSSLNVESHQLKKKYNNNACWTAVVTPSPLTVSQTTSQCCGRNSRTSCLFVYYSKLHYTNILLALPIKLPSLKNIPAKNMKTFTLYFTSWSSIKASFIAKVIFFDDECYSYCWPRLPVEAKLKCRLCFHPNRTDPPWSLQVNPIPVFLIFICIILT